MSCTSTRLMTIWTALAILGVVPLTVSAGPIAPGSPIAQWTFNEGNGLTADDPGFYDKDATLVGNASFAVNAGKTRGTLELPGPGSTAGAYATVPDNTITGQASTDLRLDTEFTIEAWVKISDVPLAMDIFYAHQDDQAGFRNVSLLYDGSAKQLRLRRRGVAFDPGAATYILPRLAMAAPSCALLLDGLKPPTFSRVIARVGDPGERGSAWPFGI